MLKGWGWGRLDGRHVFALLDVGYVRWWHARLGRPASSQPSGIQGQTTPPYILLLPCPRRAHPAAIPLRQVARKRPLGCCHPVCCPLHLFPYLHAVHGSRMVHVAGCCIFPWHAACHVSQSHVACCGACCMQYVACCMLIVACCMMHVASPACLRAQERHACTGGSWRRCGRSW